MKTKDFIKMLQNEDPSGECHIRINGKMPDYVENKPGYWDGPYTYLDEDDNYVLSTVGDKIDICTMGIEEFVQENTDISWEELKNKFKFDLTYSNPNNHKERMDFIINKAKKIYDEIKEINDKIYSDSLIVMRENAKKGWKWFQNKDVDKNETPNYHIYYTWKIYNDKDKEENSNVYNTQSIQQSGEWIKKDNNIKKGYYEWIYKNN